MKQEIQAAFNIAASDYEHHATVQRLVGEALLARLDCIKMTPHRILDLGCGSGVLTRLLRKKYPKAHIVGLDIAACMLARSKKKQSLFKKWSLCQADMCSLPLQPDTCDLVFANQTIHWAGAGIAQLLTDIYRVMRPEAYFLFSTPGPDTFAELRTAWERADACQHTNDFYTLQTLGDGLQRAQLRDVVLDVDTYTLHYASAQALLQSLKKQGVRNIHANRPSGLMGRKTFQRFLDAMGETCTPEGKYPLTYEIFFGHAWKRPGQSMSGDIIVPIEKIMRASS